MKFSFLFAFFCSIIFTVPYALQSAEMVQMYEPILKDKPRPKGKLLQRNDMMKWQLQPLKLEKGKRYLLSFLARYELPLRFSGQYGLQIKVNGKIVTPWVGHQNSGISRIVNRKSETFHGTNFDYYANGAWNVGSNLALERVEVVHAPVDGMEIWHYQLDVTDLLNGKSDIVEFKNCGTQALLGVPEKSPIPLRVSGINVQAANLSELPDSLLRGFEMVASSPLFRLKPDGGTHVVTFPAWQKKNGKTAILRIKSRLDIGQGKGASRALKVMVNGKLLTVRTANKSLRILNRVQNSFAGYKLQAINKAGVLAIMHNSSSILPAVPKNISIKDQQQSYWTYLEIGDMLYTDKVNQITFVNLEKNSVWKKAKKVSAGKPELEVSVCEIGEVESSRCAEAVSRNIPVRQKSDGPTFKNSNYTLTLHPEYGFQLKNAAGEYFFFDSYFSVPRGSYNRWNCRGAENNTSEWKTHFKKTANGFEITGSGKYYTIKRRIVCLAGRIDIFDSITNVSTRLIGLIAGTRCISSGTPVSNWVIGSPEDVSTTYGKHENPGANSTIFLQMQKDGLGITVNDDVFRLQCDFLSKGQLSGISTSHLGIKANETYTLEWSLYPMKSSDYFNFINTVRNDWKVNHRTLLGTFTQQKRVRENVPLEKKFTPQYRTYLNNLGVRLLIPFWYDYRFSPDKLSRFKRELDWYHKNTPEVRVLLPVQSVFMRRVKAGAKPDFADSIMYRANGKMPKYNVAKDGSYSPYRYYTLKNSYYAHTFKTVKEALDMGFDGIYFDTPFCVQSGYARFTYDCFDGRTVDIDPGTFEISRKYADLALLSREAWLEIAKYIVGRNKTILFNNPPIYRELNTLPGSIHFMTEGDQPFRFGRLHLSTPTMLGIYWRWRSPFTASYGRRKTWQSPEDFVDDMVWKLKHGVLYFVYCPPIQKIEQRDDFFPPMILKHEWPTKYMFPSTVTDIHAGWVRAHERIITCVAGSFSFPKKCQVAKLRMFDKKGTPLPPKMLKAENGVFKLNPPKNGIAILIRKD